MLFEREGYWVKPNFKVELTKEEKRIIGRPSNARWELDLVAYKGATNAILVVECKSFFDSPGVRYNGFDGSNPKAAKQYKLFNETILRDTVLNRLKEQLKERGACTPSPTVTLALAAGKIVNETDRAKIREHFKKNNWELFDQEWLKKQLESVSHSRYENEVAAIVAKILLRGGPS